jgi:hypothetical protein
MVQLRFTLLAVLMALSLFLGMLLFLELGRRLGIRQTAKHGTAARSGVGVVDSVVYAVFSLLLGFTFSGATTRFDHRRNLIVEEVGAMSTAWSRLDALPAEPQTAVRAAFRRYVDIVIESYAHGKPIGSPEELRQQAGTIAAQNDLWTRAVAASLTPDGEKARMLVLPGLNEMFDAVDRERLARRMHPPTVIWLMLGLAALAASLFAGYSMSSAATRSWLHIVGVAATISIVTFVIIDLEFPRLGLIRVDAMDTALVELRATIDTAARP